MRRRGHRPILACRPTCWLGKVAREHGIPVHELPFSGKFHIASIRALVAIIRHERVEVVSTHSGIDSWAGGIAARWAGVRLVRTRHLNLPLKRHPWNFVHYLPHAIVSCGEVIRNGLLASGFPDDLVTSIPTGIDFSDFRPVRERDGVRASLHIDAGTFVMLSVGVIRKVKRHDIALRAFAAFREQLPESLLLVAGDGPKLGDMQRLADELKIADSVRFLGHRDDIPDLMRCRLPYSHLQL